MFVHCSGFVRPPSMGCGSSTEYQPGGLKAPSEGSSVEELLLQLWAERSKAGNIATIAEKLIAAAPSQMDQVELYLPQFAHIVANLADELAVADVTALERFLLFVSQLSIHMVRPPPKKYTRSAHRTDCGRVRR